jgi:hypothetical protein
MTWSIFPSFAASDNSDSNAAKSSMPLEFCLWSNGKMSAGGGGGGRKNFRKRAAAGSDDEDEKGSAVVQKAKAASAGPLVASTAKPKKREDAFYESARTAVPSIGKDNGATAPVIDEEAIGTLGSSEEPGKSIVGPQMPCQQTYCKLMMNIY